MAFATRSVIAEECTVHNKNLETEFLLTVAILWFRFETCNVCKGLAVSKQIPAAADGKRTSGICLTHDQARVCSLGEQQFNVPFLCMPRIPG